MKKRIFIQSIFPAPYRTGVFSLISKEYDVFVAFERNSDYNRNKDWFVENFEFNGVVLDNKENIRKYKSELGLLNTYNAVICYDYTSFSSAVLMLKCIRKRIPYLINCDGALEKNDNIIKSVLKRFFIINARACLASGKHATNYFLTYGAKKENIFTHNFSSLYKKDILLETTVRNEKIRIRKRLGLPVDKTIVVSVGQFTHRKGFDILLKSWKLINANSCLLLIGGGEKEQEYRRIVIEDELENVIIENYKTRNVIFDYFKASDLFVLPTREDIWGLVINEAMACGLPIITTNKCVAGLELIEDNINGFIVEREDYKELAEKISQLLENEELRLSMSHQNLRKIRPYIIEEISNSHLQTLSLIFEDSI